MPKRIVYLLVAVVLITAATFVLFRTMRRGDSSRQDGATGEQPAAGAGPARVLLNEVVFQPPAGQPQWVELVNTGGEPATLDGVVLENHTNDRFALPNGLRLPAGSVLLVRFDGQSGADASTIHAPSTTFLAHDGFIQLTGSQGQLDRIAWGDRQPDAANMSRGGYQDELTPGSSLGRVPRLIGSDPLEWVPYSPQQATPGRPNPQPAVEILLPVDGAIVSAGAVSLTWYGVAGAVRYRVQVAADKSFGSPLFDQMVDQPPVAASNLSPGSYVWRVQAMTAEGAVAEYSPASALTVRSGQVPAPGRRRSMLDWVLPPVHAQTPQEPNIDDQLPTVLDVPLIMQHKDTKMLVIEERRETGHQHAWDADHPARSGWCTVCMMNSAPASVAMLTAFYGGSLSQDRINYEVFHADRPGPQGDLNWLGPGYNRERVSRAMAFAFGVPPRIDPPELDELVLQPLWTTRINSTPAMPAIACKNDHCVAVVGFGGANLLVLNDPASGTYLAPLSFLQGATVFVMGRPNSQDPSGPATHPMLVRWRSDEPEVSRDSDGDGVVDFDEIHRFKTSPKLKDHDGDELPDKEDIRASVHDRRYGFAYDPARRGRDFDGDGKMMELDDDADNGGCLDGWEDANKNGKFEQGPGETDNFLKDDDPCIRGDYKATADLVVPGPVPGKFQHRLTATVSLKPQPDGSLTGRGNSYFFEESVRFQESAACKYSMTVGPLSWSVDYIGRVTTLSDGNLEVSIQPVQAQSPPVPIRTTNACPPFSFTQTTQVASWPLQGPYKLVNGLYKHGGQVPTAHGTAQMEFTLEQKRAQGR